ncbi:MAG: hypothetical protein ACI9R3_005264 [Verrucomicrobiales bacterium]|jgi:hypothetical protein
MSIRWTQSIKSLTRLLGVGILALSAISAVAEERIWTDTIGRKLSAKLLSVEKNVARLRLSTGKVSNVSLLKLSEADRNYVVKWRTRRIRWPDEVDVSGEVEVATVKEDESNKDFVYTTKHFKFHSDSKIAGSLIKDFSLAFEATFAAVAALPLRLDPKPPEGHFVIRLFGDRFDYYAAGGMLGTAGVYIPLERHILVPMEGLNLKRVGSELRKKNGEYDNSTLIHEITHQVMHDWLKHMPTWMVEGMAEYMSSLPYSNGKFRFSESARKNAIKDGIARWEGGFRQSSHTILPATKLFKVNSREWNQTKGEAAVMNYSSSMLYVYYFMHLAGRGEGEAICAYTEAIRQAKPGVKPYLEEFNGALREYVEKVEAVDASEGKIVLTEEDVPEILRTPPDSIIFKKGSPHERALTRMFRGQTPQELSKAVISAFDEFGIRLQ